jgi:YgiT-type zinc finger domain-containing protein
MTMKCPLCGGQRIAGSTTFTADLGFGVVVVRHVPAQVCQQCGEDWLDDSIASALEKVVANARARRTVVDVSDWRAQAA